MTAIRPILIIVLIGLVSACGFHLRSASTLPNTLKQIQLIDNTLTTNQQIQLRQILKKAGAQLNSDSPNRIQLKVAIIRLPERTLVNKSSAQQSIIRITKQLEYSVRQQDDTTALKIRTIQRQIDITQDSNHLLGSESEKQTAEQTLDRTLFNQLMNQLKKI